MQAGNDRGISPIRPPNPRTPWLNKRWTSAEEEKRDTLQWNGVQGDH